MLSDFFRGALSTLTVTATPQLYRYPYRTNSEALRGDMKRISGDIALSLDKMATERDDYGE